MAKRSLIDRIGEIGNLEEVTSSVCNALSVPHINPREVWETMPYLKYDLSDEVALYIGDKDFRHNVYNSVNKDVLKRVYYGIRSTDMNKVPLEFLEKLTNWEKVYFFRGRWKKRNPDLSEPLLVLTARHMDIGLDMLHEDHFVRKAKRKYKSSKKFPESDSVREDCSRIIENYQNQILEPRLPEKKPKPVPHIQSLF